MTIIETLVRLRDDLKEWVTNNLLFLEKKTRHIEDDGSGALNIIDEQGNMILRVDEDGLETTEVKAKRLLLNGVDVSDIDPTVDYSDVENAPAIEDDGSDALTVQDAEGNTVFRVDENGITTTKVTADGVDLGDAVDKLNVAATTAATQMQELDTEVTELQELVGETPVAQQIEEALATQESGGGTATSMANITDDGSGELTVEDDDGNVVLRVDADGVTTTQVNTEKLNDTNEELTVQDADGNIVFRLNKDGIDTVGVKVKGKDVVSFTTDETLTLEDGVLTVNMATEVGDQTLPVSAAAVNTTVGNIEVLLATI